MASNGRLSIFDLSYLWPTEMVLAQSKSRINWFCIFVAIIAAVAITLLPLQSLLLIVAISLCLLLIPSTLR